MTSFLTINADDQDSELTIKSIEQQRQELERFEELKKCYQCAIIYIKANEIADATNVLINLYDTELFSFKSFDAKQLQKAVLKLILSLKVASPERQLSICFKGLELFPDEKNFWEHCGDLLLQSEKYDEASEIYNYLFKSDPFSSFYLEKYVLSLKKAFKFDDLENLKLNLMNSGWIDEGNEQMFDWKSDLSNLITVSNASNDANIDILSIPLKNSNWTNYAVALYDMATGNYTKIFKKHPFNPENYSILNGPCQIELCNNTAYSQTTNTQSLLANSVHDYSASSMEDISKKRSLRRKEPRGTQSLPLKSELNPADLVKHLKKNLNFDEQKVVDILCSTERSCLQLLDKNNIVSTNTIESESIIGSQYTIEALNKQISHDNEVLKPLAQRIFELIVFFFVQSRQPSPEFPQSLSKPMIDLWELFKIGVFPMDVLKDSLNEQFSDLLLGVCEVYYTLNKDLSYELGIYKHFFPNIKDARLELLELLLNPNEEEKFKKLTEFRSDRICTRYSYPLAAEITLQTLSNAIKVMKLSKSVDLIESSESAESEFNPEESLKMATGEMKLRLCKIILSKTKPEDQGTLKEALLELIKCHGDLEITKFVDFLNCFTSGFNLIDSESKCTFSCIFWNIFTRKQLIPNNLMASLTSSFAHFLASFDDLLENIEAARFILNWMAQEKCFGAANGLVPLKIFHKSAVDSDKMKFAYSVIFSLFRFPNIFAGMDPELGLEDWDRAPIGLATRDSPCPNLSESDFFALSKLIHEIDLKIEDEDTGNQTKIVISEPGFVSFVDWLKKQFEELSVVLKGKQFFYCVELNRNHLSAFFNAPLDLHAQKQVSNPSRGHYTLEADTTESFRYLLNTRSDIVYSELQGRKKSLEILKTIRSDLKRSLSFNISDAEVWKLLGSCYHDAAIHFMSSEAEVLQQSGKLKRCIKKAILSFIQGLKMDGIDQVAWTKLMDLIDWSLHEPSLLSTDPQIVNYLCSIGCSCVQNLLPGAIPRDKWTLFLRLELFLRKSGNLSDPQKQLELLFEASQAACFAYSENVYESTALYMSLVKFYSRLSKLRIAGVINEIDLSTWLTKLNLPNCLNLTDTADISADMSLLNHFDALNVLDRKKIFHSHLTAMAWHSTKVLNDPQMALTHLQNLFPFLKQQSQVIQSQAQSQGLQKKTNSASLLQIYQCEHERPARFLVAGKRYLLQLLTFLNEHANSLNIGSLPEILIQFLKKLHYIRKTILGFSEILLKATQMYLNCPERDEEIVAELVDTIKSVFNGKIPDEIKVD